MTYPGREGGSARVTIAGLRLGRWGRIEVLRELSDAFKGRITWYIGKTLNKQEERDTGIEIEQSLMTGTLSRKVYSLYQRTYQRRSIA